MVLLSIRTRESREKVCLLMTRWIVRMEKAGFFEINAAYSKSLQPYRANQNRLQYAIQREYTKMSIIFVIYSTLCLM